MVSGALNVVLYVSFGLEAAISYTVAVDSFPALHGSLLMLLLTTCVLPVFYLAAAPLLRSGRERLVATFVPLALMFPAVHAAAYPLIYLFSPDASCRCATPAVPSGRSTIYGSVRAR